MTRYRRIFKLLGIGGGFGVGYIFSIYIGCHSG